MAAPLQFTDLQVRSAYVHVPFCKHRCGYCNFTLLAGREELVPQYLAALESEFQDALGESRQMDTIFVGGGTPTHLTEAELEQLLAILSQWLPMVQSGEFTFEANPVDCTPSKLMLLAEAGVNRLSLGGQSFSPRKLALLERDHDAACLQKALDLASKFIPRVSLDLIFGTPEETISEWRSDLHAALAAPIEHLSTYGLTIEKGSAFFGRMGRGEMQQAPSEDQLNQYEATIELLTQKRWDHYEVSSFAKPQAMCRHNQAYWEGRPWWGFGPGAASFLPCTDGSKGARDTDAILARRVNHRSTTTYLRRIRSRLSPVAEEDWLTLEQVLRERLVFGLRQLAGVDLAKLELEFDRPIRPLFEPYLTRFLAQGWLELNGSRLRLTRPGLLISDSLWPDLLVDL